jgi:hypothetical protein
VPKVIIGAIKERKKDRYKEKVTENKKKKNVTEAD